MEHQDIIVRHKSLAKLFEDRCIYNDGTEAEHLKASQTSDDIHVTRPYPTNTRRSMWDPNDPDKAQEKISQRNDSSMFAGRSLRDATGVYYRKIPGVKIMNSSIATHTMVRCRAHRIISRDNISGDERKRSGFMALLGSIKIRFPRSPISQETLRASYHPANQGRASADLYGIYSAHPTSSSISSASNYGSGGYYRGCIDSSVSDYSPEDSDIKSIIWRDASPAHQPDNSAAFSTPVYDRPVQL